jgi:crotonobetainyl-CoA:carnitine CoA-transferase CaiB-like acyl-CoA transferase
LVAAPLDDVTVIEVDSWMAAPSAAAILADMGATVIKVEPLGGDPMRDMGRPVRLGDGADPARAAYDYQFDVSNRGKRSIAVAIDTEDGREVVHRLCRTADVFVCNLLIHRQERFGLDPATLLAVNSQLVHATLTGYGTTGPEAWRPGYDVTAFFGRSGIYDAMREGPDGVVPMARPAQGDYTAGLALVSAILAGLRLAERTGEGQVVETSLYETAVWTQATDFSVMAVDKAPLRPRARANLILPTANRYPCGDGRWLVVNMMDDSAWPLFCRTIGRDSWLEDERLDGKQGRFRHMEELVAGIDETLSARSRDEWGKIFDEAGIIWGPVLGLHEVVVDPQAHALNLFPELEDGEIGRYPTVASPVRFHRAPVGPRSPAPGLGADTRSVLAAAGYGHDEIDQLLRCHAVGEATGKPAVNADGEG